MISIETGIALFVGGGFIGFVAGIRLVAIPAFNAGRDTTKGTR